MTVPIATGVYFPPLDARESNFWRPGLSLVVVVGVHVLLVLLLGYAATRLEVQQPIQTLTVRLFEVAAPTSPKPVPLPPQAVPKKKITPPPILAAAPKASSAETFSVQSPPVPVVVASVQPPTPVPVTITEARFDADYLHNPKPKYPVMSRRLNEEGKVLLRVQVSAQGNPLAVEIKESSGFSRLDEAARTTVEHWRFVPARRGNEAVEASVLVPLSFKLSN